MDRVAADVVLCVLDGRALGQDAHRTLRGVVVGGISVADDPGDRGQVDDGPSAGHAHRRKHRLDAEKDAFHVDVQHPVQLSGAGILDETPRVDAGVVDEHRRPSEGLGHERDRLRPLGLGCHVERHEAGPVAFRFERLAERGAVLGAHVGERHRGPLGRESARDRGADSRGRAGDECDFAFESHGRFPRGAAAWRAASGRIDDEQDLIVFDELRVARADPGDAPACLCVDCRVQLHDLHEAERRIRLDPRPSGASASTSPTTST